MPHSTTFMVLAGLSIAGAAIGVGLGSQTASAIDPAYFQDQEGPNYADLAPGGSRGTDWGQVQAQEYQAEAQAPPPAGCAGCTWPVLPTAQPDPAAARVEQARAAVPVVRERAEAPVQITIVEPPAEPDWGRVERYTRYPVDRDDDPPPPPEAPAERDAGTQ